MFDQVIDANINRVTEGLRVVEEYCRFVDQQPEFAKTLSTLRKQLHRCLSNTYPKQLFIRNIEKDTRAKEPPAKRKDLVSLLTANFKRAAEGLRVLEEYKIPPSIIYVFVANKTEEKLYRGQFTNPYLKKVSIING